jgi:hypothetical protein
MRFDRYREFEGRTAMCITITESRQTPIADIKRSVLGTLEIRQIVRSRLALVDLGIAALAIEVAGCGVEVDG